MAQWESTTQNSEIDVRVDAETSMDLREGSRSAAGASKGWSLGGYDVVGIDATKVGPMREQIRTSVHNIDAVLEGIEEATDASGAFRSEAVQEKVREYLTSVETYSRALVSNLLAFSDKLKAVEEAWTKSTENFAGSVGATTDGFADASKFYTEKK